LSGVRARHPGRELAAGLAITTLAAVAPAGLRGEAVPLVSWLAWLAALAAGIAAFRAAGSTPSQLLRRVAFLLPFVLVLVLPAALLAPADTRGPTAFALLVRALSASVAAAGVGYRLGPLGIVRGARALGAPERLVELLEASLVGLATTLERARAMLRAREARRPGPGAWALLLREPVSTVRGFGRFGGALLLRSLERAEAQQRARLARGADLR
jgi:hypothetical protein